MSDIDQGKNARLQAILSQLLQHRLSKSLTRMDEELGQWRRGELGVFEAHAEVLKHAARAERMATRVAQAGTGDARNLLRDAFDEGLLSQADFVELTGAQPEDVAPSEDADDRLSMPLKRDLVTELLDQGPVLVHIDARMVGVSVPEHLAEDSKLVLRFGYGLTPAIPDLEVDADAMSGTLTFNKIPHRCILPWTSVYAVVSEADQRGMVWPEDVPKEVLQEMAPQAPLPPMGATPAVRDTQPETTDDSKSKKGRRSHLKLVD